MPSKRSSNRTNDRTAEQADYRTWKAHAAALLKQQHDLSAGAIPERIWRTFYVVQRVTPEQAAEEAKSYYNNFVRRPLWVRKR
jgi:hypothetical protein